MGWLLLLALLVHREIIAIQAYRIQLERVNSLVYSRQGMKLFFLTLAAAFTFASSAVPVSASIATDTAGMILLSVEEHGEGWYVDPVTTSRCFLNRAEDAYAIMRAFGLGITDANLAKIPVGGTNATGDPVLQKQLSGRILLQVEQHGEAWYVYPKNLHRYYLGRAEDAYAIMSELGLGITVANLATIPEGDCPTTGFTTDLPGVTVEARTIDVDSGTFTIDVVEIEMDAYEMVTATGNIKDCENDCLTRTVEEFVIENAGQIGINGSYFCPDDYRDCALKTNSFLSPVYNRAARRLINEDVLIFHEGPMISYTDDGTYSYYHRADDFGTSLSNFLTSTRAALLGAIANYPGLVENGRSIVKKEPTFSPDMAVPAVRVGIGFTNDTILLVVAKDASVYDLASIFVSLDADDALNLDGGSSTSIYIDGEYVKGPGRDVPNAIIFRRKE